MLSKLLVALPIKTYEGSKSSILAILAIWEGYDVFVAISTGNGKAVVGVQSYLIGDVTLT